MSAAERICPQCGSPLSEDRHKNAQYCSKRCLWRANATKDSARRAALRAVMKCQGCGEPIADAASRKRKWCSDICKDRAYRKRHPDVVRGYHRKWSHLRLYGHTEYLANPSKNKWDRYAAARAQGYRSGLEVKIANDLKAQGVAFEYETLKIPYVQPSKKRTYVPDIVLPNGILVELKGRLETADRQKLSWIREQHPEVDLRMLFSNSKSRISKLSNTTYGMWCDGKGIPYADKEIPMSWLKEKPNAKSLAAIAALKESAK